MKHNLLFVLILFIVVSINNVNSQGVSINENGTDPDASAMLDIQSTTKGLLNPTGEFMQKCILSTVLPLDYWFIVPPTINFTFLMDHYGKKLLADADEDWDIDGNDMYSIILGILVLVQQMLLPTHKLTIENARWRQCFKVNWKWYLW